MPRPAPAQLAYGLVTVVCSTLAMLLLSDATSGMAVMLIAVVALALGLLVALTAPLVRSRREDAATEAGAGLTAPATAPASAVTGTAATSTAAAGTSPAATEHRTRVPQASLRR
ncbi:hypothetical protein LHJ74_15265 [Streptomyces sp. N2-109]|uniref:Secreted protein n=1 Tax=Streptomyces gossypii TaxID=2883101 RepID=A0ABT2JV70_9ACTN|nr:hypothetical protein [Streptomyces gossypii]MCT2591250.1 hypothetical protein [Streptomyces gossypii]